MLVETDGAEATGCNWKKYIRGLFFVSHLLKCLNFDLSSSKVKTVVSTARESATRRG